MQIKVLDQSTTLKAYPLPYVDGGKLRYELNFNCAHGNVEVMNGEVLCHDCDNNDMTSEQEVEILEAYADLRHSVEEDNAIQNA